MNTAFPWTSIPYPVPDKLDPAHHQPDCGAPATGGAGVDVALNENRCRLICVPSGRVIVACVASVNVMPTFATVVEFGALYGPVSVCPPFVLIHVLLYAELACVYGPVETSQVSFPLASYTYPPTNIPLPDLPPYSTKNPVPFSFESHHQPVCGTT